MCFRYAAKNNLPMLNHVSLPRVGALKVIIDEAGPKMPSSSPYSTVNNVETTNNSKKGKFEQAKTHFIISVVILLYEFKIKQTYLIYAC